MHLIDQRLLGILIFVLLAILIAVKRIATGSIFERPPRRFFLQLVNIFNLFFLIVVNPLVAFLLVFRKMPGVDPTALVLPPGRLLTFIEIAGFVIYLLGFILMGWALIYLGRNYQLGGSDPRAADAMIQGGPYALVRHPMYAAALYIALGLAGLTQSAACLGVFVVYLALILFLIPVEEESLRKVYGDRYEEYRRKVKRLIPLFY